MVNSALADRAPWRDLTERYGPWQTVYERFARRETDGTRAELPEHVQVNDDAVGTVEWTVSMDSTVLEAVRVPRLSAGRPRRRPETVIADKARSS